MPFDRLLGAVDVVKEEVLHAASATIEARREIFAISAVLLGSIALSKVDLPEPVDSAVEAVATAINGMHD